MLKIIQTGRIRDPGEVAEWLNVAVSKTVVRANVPRVRIPLSPPYYCLLTFILVVTKVYVIVGSKTRGRKIK